MQKIKVYLYTLIVFFIASSTFYGQLSESQLNSKVDSLKKELKLKKEDSLNIKAFYELADLYSKVSKDSAVIFINKGIHRSIDYANTSNGRVKERALFFVYKGYQYKGQHYFKNEQNDSAIYYFNKGFDYAKKINNHIASAECINNIGFILYQQGDIKNALTYFYKSLGFLELAKDSVNIANLLSNIGYIHKSQEDYDKALDCFNQGLNINLSINDSMGVAYSYNDIGVVYTLLKDTTKALTFLENSLELRKLIGNKRLIASSLQNTGYLYIESGDFEKGFDLLNQGAEIYEELNDKEGKCKNNQFLAAAFIKKEDYSRALVYAEKNLELAKELKYPNLIKLAASQLVTIYKNLGKGLEALEMYELYINTRDSLKNESNLKASIEQESRYEYEKLKLIDDAENEKRLAVEMEKKEKQYVYTVFSLVVLCLVILFLVFLYRRLQVTKRQRTKIQMQKSELESTHKELEEVTTEIRDSIDYAELIQRAVLPSLKIEDLTKDSFIYFNPKEKVSGDFFWFEQRQEYNGYAVADCTGHGIPGAFISMIGTILLNEIYNSKQIDIPNQILDELSRLVKLTLTDKEGYTMKDGMDISFAVLNNETKMLYFSGANNPVWIASKNPEKRINKETALPIAEVNGLFMYEIKGDKQPIGEYGENVKPFTLNNAHLEEGDAFYLFSDGYVDQFGGERNKKFKAKPFRELLLSINEKPMEEQKKVIDQNFQDWKGDYEQIDDVTVMGVRV